MDGLRLVFSLPTPLHWSELASHRALAVLLDLDGTLVGFAATPEQAVLDDEACAAARALVESGARVTVVSGRPRSAVDPLIAKLGAGVTYFAEHGAWHHDGHGWTGPEAGGQDLDVLVTAIAATSSRLRVERKSLSVCVHWRSVEPAARPPLIAATELAFEEWLESHPEFELLPGVESLEVRRRDINKGVAVHRTRQLEGTRIIAIGDDLTDEDMFAELGEGDIGITVGHHTRPSKARAALAGPPEVHAFLRWLASARTGATATSPQLLPLVDMKPSRAHSLVVISNRTPTKVLGRKREVGGLVSALEPALRAQGGIWVGWSGHEREGKPALMIDALGEPNLATFDLTRALRERFYAGFCNRVLWPLFHSASMRITYSDDEWAAYVAANDTYAGHAAELSRPDGTIWVHDYHLLLAARSLRQRGHRGPIGLFLHTPFPPLELLETMPWHRELIAAMQEFDLVGFHTERWAANFRTAVDSVESVHASPRVGVFPIPIDSSPFLARTAESSDVAGLRAALGSRRLLLGVDRLDYSKGIPERLAGYQRMLERYPEWRGQVSFVQVSVPSRAEIPEYSELRDRIEKMVGTINGQFGEADWVPVRYLYRSYDQPVLAQLYRLADVALVTPLRDGMNLVAKEFLASQDDARPGVLVLSRFAGAAAELGDAVLTNPFHPDGLAADIDRALRMPEPERVARHGRMIQAIRRSTPQQWSSEFLKDLAGAARTRAHATWPMSDVSTSRCSKFS